MLQCLDMKSGVITSPVNMKERASLGLRAGDTVRVWQKIKEGDKTRRQAFEGLILAVKHGTEAGATFTVRRVASGVGVEKIFPLYTPTIESVEVLRRTRTRRAKLYFIRRKAARDVKHAMRKSRAVTEAETPAVAEEPKAEPQTPIAAE